MSLSSISRPRIASFSLPALLALCLLAGSGVAQDRQTRQERRADQGPVPQEQLRHAFALSDAFRAVTRAVGPSVVSIRASQQLDAPEGAARPRSPMEDEFFRRFFDLPEGFQLPDSQQMPRQRMGQGSGVVVRQDGYIITNNHVVENATQIRVQLNGEEHDATIVGTDPESDLAVIKIEASGLTPARLGNSDQMEVGDWVLAIGSPFGYDNTVTAGIVSAKGRQVGIIRDPRGFAGFEDFIQTDAAINPGNSGGPLVNLHGEVIGISTAIATRTGVNVGIGFAIPSNMAQPVVQSIIETGRVQRGALGVGIQGITPDVAERFGFQGTGGVIISQVNPGSAAERAGLRMGDIITRVAGQPVTDNRMLMTTVAGRAPGETVELEVFRNGRTFTREVVLDDRTVHYAAGQQPARPAGAARTAQQTLGLAVQELTPQIAQQFGYEGESGVVVTRVVPDTPAARQGIARGDVIARVDDHEIASVDDFNRAITEADLSRGVALQVFRGPTARVVVLRSGREARR